MKNNWANELQRLAWLLTSCFFIGWLLGYALQGLVVGCAIHLIWNFSQLRRIHAWLMSKDKNQEPPELPGFWGAVCDKIYYLQRDQQRIQAKLEADVAYLHSSFASLSDAVVMINGHGTIDWCNTAARSNLGLRYPQDLGQHLLHLFRDPQFLQYFDGLNYDKGIEVKAPNNGQKTLWVQLTRFGEGDRLLFARDITEVQKLEQMRRDFVSNVSHELRTPLTVISGYIDNFHLFTDKIPQMALPLEQMAQNAQRMEYLLRDLIDLSRLETLPNEMHSTSVSLSLLSRMIVEEAQASLGDETRVINVDIQEHVDIWGNQLELHSALLNILINACKYTHDQGLIELICRKDEKGAYFSVTDDGVGIEATHIPRLTERFYRVDPSRSINTGGTGLGLAIVKHVLIRHDGELLIESSPGQGSTFSCHFSSHRLSE
ncbi:MAG: phosphate regulon sensor histidine kinase PhoR [Pseudomonadales bacterium]|nr:phosphate regulon sensor histidine kinase PhoR [Pseudomonadales bacterium]